MTDNLKEREAFEAQYRKDNNGSTLYCESQWRGWQSRAAIDADRLARGAVPALTITGHQLREAMDFLAPDGTAEQLEQSVCIQHGPERVCDAGTPDESTDPAGLYCWIADYPEEGSIALTSDEWSNPVAQAKPEQAAQPMTPQPKE